MLSYHKVMMLAELEYSRLKSDKAPAGTDFEGHQLSLPSDQIHALAHALIECVEDELEPLRDQLQELQDRVGEIEWTQGQGDWA